MRSALRRMGNSAGVIIPKPLLADAGIRLGDPVDVVSRDGELVIVPVRRPVRAGWAEAARTIADAGDDRLVWPELKNEDGDLA